MKDRNRAFNTDIVVVKLYPREEWKVSLALAIGTFTVTQILFSVQASVKMWDEYRSLDFHISIAPLYSFTK